MKHCLALTPLHVATRGQANAERTARKNVAKINEIISEACIFPADFTEADVDKFTGEVASEVGKFLPKGQCEDLIDDVTASSKAITFKLEKVKHKADKGETVQYSFRLALYLQIMAARKVAKITGYRAHTLDLSMCRFWEQWKRAEVTPEPAPEQPAASAEELGLIAAPAPAPATT